MALLMLLDYSSYQLQSTWPIVKYDGGCSSATPGGPLLGAALEDCSETTVSKLAAIFCTN